MALPKTYKNLLKHLIAIAENGNEYNGYNYSKMTEKDSLEIGCVIADIQNWLGENDELLEKFNLKYDSSI